VAVRAVPLSGKLAGLPSALLESLALSGAWRELVQRMATLGAVATVVEFNQTTLYLSKSFPKEENSRKENK